VTKPEEITAIGEALRSYEKATGAMLKIAKSLALAVGMWYTMIVLNIPYSAETKILGLRVANTTAQSTISSWSWITKMVRTQAHEAYSRDLDLAKRIQYVHTYPLSKLWHTAKCYRPQSRMFDK
jgi:hypothetical protein